jgi:two-component system chemotaxis sensor kinase CheA
MENRSEGQPVGTVRDGAVSLGQDAYLRIRAAKVTQLLDMVVDELIGQQQVLIQPLQGHLVAVPSVSGCALLGEGEVGMVLNLSSMEAWIG